MKRSDYSEHVYVPSVCKVISVKASGNIVTLGIFQTQYLKFPSPTGSLASDFNLVEALCTYC